MKFEYRPSYGRQLFYPVDDEARELLAIFQKYPGVPKSFTETQLRVLAHFGVVVEIVAPYDGKKSTPLLPV